MITANNTGNATITATCNSVQTTTRITVVSPIVSIRLVPASLLMTVGSSSRTSVIFQPIQSAIPITSWTSSNSAVATVDSNGIVRALKVGNARITGTVNDKTATRIVTVR
jgi:alpha-amylase